jgi:hypothetical protein
LKVSILRTGLGKAIKGKMARRLGAGLVCFFLFILTCSGVFADQDAATGCKVITINDLAGKDTPRYEAFSTRVVPIADPAKVNLKSHPKAKRYRTRIREGAAEGPNFAGHFTIVGWGCGTSCVQWAIVDAQTGAVYFPPDEIASISTVHVGTAEGEPEPHFYGLRFRKDSELLMLLGAPNEDESREGILFYRWTGKTFKFVKAYKIQRDWGKCGGK